MFPNVCYIITIGPPGPKTEKGVDMKKYQVIGGYRATWYGESESLTGAKIIASRDAEYWDNYIGWVKPHIYLASDCVEGDPTEFNYSGIHLAEGAKPVTVYIDGKWRDVII